MELEINHALDSIRLKDSLKRKSIELRLSEKKLSKIINSALDAILTIDQNEKIIMTNPAAEELFGFSKKELLQRSLTSLFPDENEGVYKGFYQRFLKSNLATMELGIHRVICAKNAQGREIPIEGTLSKVTIDGQTYVNAIIRNIEERVVMETELREREEQFRTLTESAPATIFKIDRSFTVKLMNKPYFNNIHVDEIVGENFLKFVQKESSYVQEIIEQVFQNGGTFQFEIVLKDHEGVDRWYTINAGAIYKDGKANSVMLLCNDTTKLYLSQRVLHALTDVQNAFIGNSSASEPFEKMLKILLSFTHSEYGFIGDVQVEDGDPDFRAFSIRIGSGFSQDADLNNPESHYVKNLLEQVIETEKPCVIEADKKNELKLSSIMGLPFFSKNKLIGIVGIAKVDGAFDKSILKSLEPILMTCSTVISAYRDSLKKQQAELETTQIKEEFTRNLEIKVSERTKELNRARLDLAQSLEKEKELSELKSRFVATASHEFRTPLSVIQSSLGALSLQTENMTPDFKVKFERSFERIKKHINRMTLLMNDVLVIGKLSAGSVGLAKQSVNLVDLCNQIINNHDEIQIDGRKLDFKSEGEIYDVMIDPKLMEHAISNLVSNAIKYSIKSEEMPSLKLKFGQEQVKIEVEDYGIGIPERDLEHLFEPFYRASNASDFNGTGLGSSIAKEYVELNGGTLSVESQVSVGSKFTIVLNNH
jgi:PAS domain S-box-containing protein